jgi:HSP20 family protein
MQIERYRNRHPVYIRPFFGFRGFRGDLDRVFTDFIGDNTEERLGVFNPAVDLVDTGESLQVKVELPGVKKEDVQITLKDDVLIIKGEKKVEREEKDENRYYVERSYGSFSRTLTLPTPVKTDEIKAGFEGGILEITLPKDEEVKTREIKVEVQ